MSIDAQKERGDEKIPRTRRLSGVPFRRRKRCDAGDINASSESEEALIGMSDPSSSTRSQVVNIVSGTREENPRSNINPEMMQLLKKLRVREAVEQDVGEIIEVYSQNIIPREVFETIAKRNEAEVTKKAVLRSFQAIGGPGELSPISSEEWIRRIKEEEVLVIRDADGKIVLVASYILGSKAFIEKAGKSPVVQELKKIRQHKSQERWFNLMKADNCRRVIMVRDGFSSKEWQNRGILPILMAKVIQHEITKDASKREIKPDELHKWYALYWVNLFCNTRIKGRSSRDFEVNQYNRGTIGALNRAGGNFLGESAKFETSLLPSAEDEKIDHETLDGRKIEITRGYFYGTLNLGNIVPILKNLNT